MLDKWVTLDAKMSVADKLSDTVLSHNSSLRAKKAPEMCLAIGI